MEWVTGSWARGGASVPVPGTDPVVFFFLDNITEVERSRVKEIKSELNIKN